MKPLSDYCNDLHGNHRRSLQAIADRFGSHLEGLNRFEKAQLLGILALTIQEHEESALVGEAIDFTPREAEQSAYPYETTEDVDFCIVTLTEDASLGLRDYLALCEAIVAQLRNA